MAQVPSEQEIKQAQQQTRKKINDKRSKQRAQGKDLILDEHSSGVIPEPIWKGMKSEEPKQ